MKNTNAFIAAILIIGFLAVWDSFVVKRYAPPKPPTTKNEVSSIENKSLASKNSSIAPAKNAPKDSIPMSAKEISETMTVLSSPDTQITVDSRGARAVSWKIKEKEHWLELVLPEKRRKFSPLETYPEKNFSVHKISESEAVFQTVTDDQILIRKTISLDVKNEFHRVTIEVTNQSSTPKSAETLIGWGNGIDKHVVGMPYDPRGRDEASAEERALALDQKVKSWRPGFIFHRSIDLKQPGSFQWIAIDNNHFIAALFPESGVWTEIFVKADRESPPWISGSMKSDLKPGQSISESYLMYVGPKDYDQLKSLGLDLVKSVDFGMFGVIAKGLLWGLRYFHSLTNNYGWAIIILTFCIQFLLLPLTIKNYRHSNRMRELQPHIKKLQDQFKSDPKRLQAETFNLYKRHGMKFMGMEGCFPILLQIPVFIAFYATLRAAYELRGAPWIFWIKDLGVYDPYYVLPILMGVGMFLQQKMTSVATDPAQARMMYMMPFIFTFMFFKLPAGLVLYWCVNSMTTIVIQSLMPKPAASPPAS